MASSSKQRVTLFIDPALVKHAKAQAVMEDLTYAELVEKALLKYLPDETVIKRAVIRD